MGKKYRGQRAFHRQSTFRAILAGLQDWDDFRNDLDMALLDEIEKEEWVSVQRWRFYEAEDRFPHDDDELRDWVDHHDRQPDYPLQGCGWKLTSTALPFRNTDRERSFPMDF